MLTIAKSRDLDYYEREVIEGRAEYLSEEGRSPGRWAGSLAAADGFTGIANRDDLAQFFDGNHPSGDPLTVSRTEITGFDLTLSPSKSVSLVWALGSDDDARQGEEALHGARAEVERYLEATACSVRRGKAGVFTEPATGFLGAVFTHKTSRLGDPGIHLHWTVFNVAEGPDGRRTALHATQLYDERYTGEAIFQATLRRELATRLGLVFDEMDRHGVAEVAGISADMRTAFSRRRTEILAEMDRMGAHSGNAARVANLKTRKAKETGISEEELRAEWRQRAADHRFDLEAMPRVPRTPTLQVDDDELALALTDEHAAYERRDVIRAVAKAARQGATLDAIVERTDQYLDGAQAIDLGAGRWTTPEMQALEQSILGHAERPAADHLRADPTAVTAAGAARPSLSDEQRAMLDDLCRSGRPVDVVVGRAGAGKTFALDAVRDAFESSGHRVRGISLAARAARELEAGAGIRSTTAHALHNQLESGRTRFNEQDVLVIDEVGMVGTRMLAVMVDAAARADAKVILVGDPKQLPPIEAGGIFTALARRPETVELVENRRQTDPVERSVVAALRTGHARAALDQLDDRGHVTIESNSDRLRDRMVLDWFAHHEDGTDAVMGAIRRSDVRDLNARAHAVLEATGQLGQPVAEIDEQRFSIGDRVLALENRYDLGVVNGDLATIVGSTDDNLRVRTDADRTIDLPLDYVADHLQHGYARTVHKTQGLTCDVALLLGDDVLYAELGYTGLTRGRHENHLYTVAADTPDDPLVHLTRSLSTSRAKIAAADLDQGVGR